MCKSVQTLQVQYLKIGIKINRAIVFPGNEIKTIADWKFIEVW